MRPGRFFAVSACLSMCLLPGVAFGQSAEEETVEASAQVLREIMAIPAKGIPEALLANAKGVAIVPGLVKGGFVVGVRHGRGVIVTREKNGAWRAPLFISITGGSVGFQAGLQATDVILVFRTQASVAGLMRGKFTIGADAAVAAGPVGRQASAATDAHLRAEILSYSRSRGLFAGVAIDGAVLHVDQRATAAFYAQPPGQPPGYIPPAALQLVQQIATYAGVDRAAPAPAVIAESPAPPVTETPPPPVTEAPAPPVAAPPDEREATRRKLAEVSQQLQTLLDPQWREYLALPAEVYTGPTPPAPDKLAPFLARYRAVAGDSRYQPLTGRREFQETLALLDRLATPIAAPPASLQLPPPPAR